MKLEFEVNPEYVPLYRAAFDVITQVMNAGYHQRIKDGKPTDEWKRESVIDRIHHMFMHMVKTQSHMQTNGNPFSLTENTALEDWKHTLCGGAIVAAHELGYMDFAPIVVDTTEDENKAE